MRQIRWNDQVVVLLAPGEEDPPGDEYILTREDDGKDLVIRTLYPDGSMTEELVEFLP